MDEEHNHILVEAIAEAIAKEGAGFTTESWVSVSKLLAKAVTSARPLSPTQRHAIATDRHIEDVCKERDRMARELAAAQEAHSVSIRELRRELQLVIDAHRNRLDWFEPHYEGLKRDYDNIKLLHFSSVLMITAGSALFALASFLYGDALKFSALAAGFVSTTYGLWTQGHIVYRSPPSMDRPRATTQINID